MALNASVAICIHFEMLPPEWRRISGDRHSGYPETEFFPTFKTGMPLRFPTGTQHRPLPLTATPNTSIHEITACQLAATSSTMEKRRHPATVSSLPSSALQFSSARDFHRAGPPCLQTSLGQIALPGGADLSSPFRVEIPLGNWNFPNSPFGTGGRGPTGGCCFVLFFRLPWLIR